MNLWNYDIMNPSMVYYNLTGHDAWDFLISMPVRLWCMGVWVIVMGYRNLWILISYYVSEANSSYENVW